MAPPIHLCTPNLGLCLKPLLQLPSHSPLCVTCVCVCGSCGPSHSPLCPQPWLVPQASTTAPLPLTSVCYMCVCGSCGLSHSPLCVTCVSVGHVAPPTHLCAPSLACSLISPSLFALYSCMNGSCAREPSLSALARFTIAAESELLPVSCCVCVCVCVCRHDVSRLISMYV